MNKDLLDVIIIFIVAFLWVYGKAVFEFRRDIKNGLKDALEKCLKNNGENEKTEK